MTAPGPAAVPSGRRPVPPEFPLMLAAFAVLAALLVAASLVVAWRNAHGGPITYVVRQIVVVPLGAVPPDDLARVVSVLERDFPDLTVTVARPMPLPLVAFSRARQQFDVDVLLTYLQKLAGDRTVRFVGVTDEDLFAAGAEYVFAQTDAVRDSVVSLARLTTPNDALAESRYRKVLRRQLGFTFGFRSSRDPDCAMYYVTTVAGLDAKGSAWCGGEADAVRRIQGVR